MYIDATQVLYFEVNTQFLTFSLLSWAQKFTQKDILPATKFLPPLKLPGSNLYFFDTKLIILYFRICHYSSDFVFCLHIIFDV